MAVDANSASSSETSLSVRGKEEGLFVGDTPGAVVSCTVYKWYKVPSLPDNL